MEEIKIITPEQVQEKIENEENVNIIDVREDHEVVNGMVPGAAHIRLGDIPERMNELDKDKEYILICHGGVRSENAAHYLQENGYKVASMAGGMMHWQGELVF